MQDIIEVDDLQHTTTKNVEISFDITPKNVCSTPFKNTKDKSDNSVLEQTSAKFVSPITEEKVRGFQWCILQSSFDDAQNSINDSNYIFNSSKVVNSITYKENLFKTDENS